MLTEEDLRPVKAALRRRVLALRATQPAALATQRSAAAQAVLLARPQWQAARCVLLYWALPDEVATADLAVAALAAGKCLVLPRIVPAPGGGRRLELRQVPGPAATAVEIVTGLVPGIWGILEPPAAAPLVEPAAVDLALVPGVAFDRDGRRLGYGGGFYDRLLPQLRPDALCLGLCFDLQVVDRVPAGRNDVTVAGIITDHGVYYTSK